jgi:hypothetical protein
MAVKTFEEIYASLSADEKKLIDNLHAKEPELKAGWLRRDDYSRAQNELKAKEGVYQEAVAYKEKMEPWAGRVYSTLESAAEKGWFDLDKGEEHFTEKYTELEQQLEAAKLGGDMDPKQLEALVTSKVQEIAKQAGGLTREEATALYAAESKKLVDAGFTEREAKFNSETIPFVAGFSAGVAVLASHYEQESGEKWNAEKSAELFKLMNADQNFDALKVEEKFLAPIRSKKEEAARVEKLAQERAEAILKERGISTGMPGGGGERFIPQPPGGNAAGLLQKALEDSGGGDGKGPIDVRDSVMAGVVEGAKELISAGKF